MLRNMYFLYFKLELISSFLFFIIEICLIKIDIVIINLNYWNNDIEDKCVIFKFAFYFFYFLLVICIS